MSPAASPISSSPGYAYRTPGVHFEWLDRSRAVTEPRTDVAGFVGIAERGPLHRPVRVETWTQFTSAFGTHVAAGYLAYAVEAFFANGGRTCWVVRVADPAEARAAALDLEDDAGRPALRLTARSAGGWGEQVLVTVTRSAPDRFSLAIRLDGGGPTELWRELSMDPDDPRYAVAALADPDAGGSRLVEALDLGSPTPLPQRTPDARSAALRFGTGRLRGGADGLRTLRASHLSGDGSPPDHPWGLAALSDVDEVAIVAIPDAMTKPAIATRTRPAPPPRCDDLASVPAPPPAPAGAPELPPPLSDDEIAAVQQAMIAHCTLLRDRVAVLDVRLEDRTPEQARAWRPPVDASYAALYYPWVLAPDPARLAGVVRAVPPCGHVAGVYAAVAAHEPPAGRRLENVAALTAETDDLAHGDLDEAGVNVLRVHPGRGIRLEGARTLSADPQWRYVNVRRLLCMIEEALDESDQWAVFEPGDAALWREVERITTAFLDDLWRRGALDGATAAEAYSVRCDATTNPPEERDAGRMICLLGVQPPWPAEFVIVRIGNASGAARGIPDAEVGDA